MKKAIKAIVLAAAVMSITFQPVLSVSAAPVSMLLTYDGKQHQYQAEAIELYVNGAPVELTLMPPIILDGRTFVPTREVFEPLGAAVDWKSATKEVYIGYNGKLVVLKPDSKTADINGAIVPLENPAKIINDKLMVPARFVAEQLGIPVNWDPNNRIVSIGTAPAAEASIETAPVETAPVETPPPETLPPVTTPTETVPQVQQPPVPTEPVTPAPSGSTAGLSIDISPAPLTQISSAEVNITGVKAERNIFTVSASAQISRVEKLLLPDNKLVIDVYNATNTLSSNSYSFGGFSGVKSVRNSQFQTAPEKITRVVFDLAGSNKYSVSMSADRKNIIVEFEENSVIGVDYSSDFGSERITITCIRQPGVTATRMFSPDRLVFDIPAANYAAGFSEKEAGGRFAQKIRASQFEAGTSRIVVDLNENAQYIITYEGNNAIITLSEPTYRNIKYEQQPYASVTLTGAQIDTSGVTHTDGYLNGRYVISLPGNYDSVFGSGTFEINDGLFKNITVQNYNGRTELVFNQKSIMAYRVENNGNLVIRPVNPKEMYKTVVYVDAGHGNSDPGAGAGGFQEKNLNLNISTHLYELLEADPEIKVYMSRLDDSYPENIDRARTANSAADLLISVHHNAATSSSSNGTEVLYLNHDGEVYPRISSEAVARIIQTNLSRDIDTTDRGVVKRPGLILLNSTTVPSVIVEVVFMTNSNDLSKVSTQEGRNKVAESLYRSIKEIFRQYPTGR